jgi:EAL domain-containing protein (putative c-di-GMP-specific phosphodiesterase class I)
VGTCFLRNKYRPRPRVASIRAASARAAIRRAGLNCGTSPRSGARRSICAARKPLFACAIHNSEWSSPLLSFRIWGSPALSQFVITQAVADWRYFLAEQRPLDLSIDLPISFLEDPNSFDYLCRQLPDDPAFAGLILEVDGSDITRDLAAVRDFARQARLRKVAISVDRLGSEWTALLQLRDFPFVEIKVEPELVAGCAYDRAKRTLCRHIVGAANQFGARTVAVGIENYADFFTARELGFDLVQGFLFAKPMGVQTFMRAIGPGLTNAV